MIERSRLIFNIPPKNSFDPFVSQFMFDLAIQRASPKPLAFHSGIYSISFSALKENHPDSIEQSNFNFHKSLETLLNIQFFEIHSLAAIVSLWKAMIKKYGLSIFVNELLSSLSDCPINYHPVHDSCTKVFQLSALIFIYVLENLASDVKSILLQVDEILISSNKF
jgi:hypothetical protein